MADTKIRFPLGIVGWTVYTRLKNESGQIWDSVSSAYVSFVVGNVARFRLATPETPSGSGDYEANMPVGSPANNYTWQHYRLMGVDAAISDPLLGGGGEYYDGTTFTIQLPSAMPPGWAATLVPAGAGSLSFPIVVNNTEGNPIANAEVWVSTDPAGDNIVAGTLLTTHMGVVTFNLDSGTYYLWKQHPQYTFSNPTQFSVP
jgi:hypothetical protein